MFRINDSISEVLSVLSGVPQGNIFGPLLLLSIYANDLPTQLKVILPYLYANDTKCLHAAKTTKTLLPYKKT